ncbi:MAG: hypothetical protein EHM48_06085, partial [Planctomycetaceae bacterium]
MSDKRLVPSSVVVSPQFENLEQRLLLTTLSAGEFFIYHNSDGQNVRVSLYGDAGTSAELFAYDTNPDQRFADPMTGLGVGYGLVDLVGLKNGDIGDQVLWPDGSPIIDDAGTPLDTSDDTWMEYSPFVPGVPVTNPPTIAGTLSVRGSRTEIFAIYLSNANENTVLTITELESDQPITDLSVIIPLETAYTDIRGFNGGGNQRLGFYDWNDGLVHYVNPPANSGGVIVGAISDPILPDPAANPPVVGDPIAFSAVYSTETILTGVAPRGMDIYGEFVFPGGDLQAGITIGSDPLTDAPANVGKIIIGGTLAGSFNTAGSVDVLEMGFIWGRVNIDQNVGEIIIRQGGGALLNPIVGPGEPTYIAPVDSYGNFDSYITVGGHAGEIRMLGGTLFTLIEVTNDPAVAEPSEAVYEIETVGAGGYLTPGIAWVHGLLNDIDNNTQDNAQFVSSATGNFHIYGDDDGGADYYAMPLFAGQTVVIDGDSYGDWSDPDLSGTVYLYDSNGRLMDTLGLKNIKGTDRQMPLTFTAPAAGIYYLVVNAGYYDIQVTGGPATSLGAVHVEGSLNGWFREYWPDDDAPNISVSNGGTIGAVEISGSDTYTVTRTFGVGYVGGNIIAYEVGSLSGDILADGNVGSVSTSGSFNAYVCAGYDNGQ